MQFQSPDLLWLFVLIPLLLAAYVWAQHRRSRFTLRYSSLSLIRDALGKGPDIRRHIPPLFFLLGIATMLLALARPTGMVTLPKEQATVILAIDVSGSMRANDLKPSRLEAAQAAARAFIERQEPSTRVGVVAFSGTAALVQAPTTDHAAALAAVNRLSRQQSTAIGSGILAALDAIFEKPNPNSSTAPKDDVLVPATPTPTPVPKGIHTPATIVLLTDGQNRTGPSPLDAARVAADRGVRVFTIGVGTTQGTTVQDRGFGFRTALDEKTLKQIAEITDALYFHASDENALLAIYQNLSKELILATEREENTVVFTAAATVLLMISGSLALFWFNRLP